MAVSSLDNVVHPCLHLFPWTHIITRLKVTNVDVIIWGLYTMFRVTIYMWWSFYLFENYCRFSFIFSKIQILYYLLYQSVCNKKQWKDDGTIRIYVPMFRYICLITLQNQLLRYRLSTEKFLTCCVMFIFRWFVLLWPCQHWSGRSMSMKCWAN